MGSRGKSSQRCNLPWKSAEAGSLTPCSFDKGIVYRVERMKMNKMPRQFSRFCPAVEPGFPAMAMDLYPGEE